MSIMKYLKENYKLLIFYIILMTFIALTILTDRSNRVLTSNLIYILTVATIMFIIFLVIDYIIKNEDLKKIKQYENSKDKTPILPVAKDSKDEAYSKIIYDIYEYYLEAIEALEEKFKENNEFMTTWVHEIKTPVTTLKLMNVEKTVEEEIDRIEDYVEKVLYYTRSDEFSRDYIISEVYVGNLIKESIKKHAIIFIRKHIRFINNIDEKSVVDTDGKWLLFILNQIISNALKYTNENGEISAYFYENNDEKIIEIKDDGVGIKEEDINRIFQKSFTGHNGRNTNLKASGLGLYLSKKMAKELGHYIKIKSVYSMGTSVYIHFPKWNDYYITKM